MEAAESNDEKTHFRVCRFLMETGVKLGLHSLPLATACSAYHRFFSSCQLTAYDPYLVALACIYLSGKLEEQHVRLRDIINVGYRCLHRDAQPLDLGPRYWELRDSLVQCEFLVLRVLGFKLTFDHPHRYLLYYLMSLRDWLGHTPWSKVPVAETAWALVRDSGLRGEAFQRFKPQHVAVGAVYLALECHGVQIPGDNNARLHWWQAVCHDITPQMLWDVVAELITTYDLDGRA
uniref:Cyclin-Q n=1 Tax=Eptatretus burgeri TaxID=7764 RepID=A0A8C4Q844_EPTBU